MKDTLFQFDSVINSCRSLFANKAKDYGTSWRIMRLPSVTDQIFIKAQRIRTIQELGIQKVQEGIKDEFIAIVNYAVIGLMQLQLSKDTRMEIPVAEILGIYDQKVLQARQLMQDKNHDYGEAWRLMRLSSLVDLLLLKIMRVKQIEGNNGKTIVSEGIEANYADMLNYAVFSLIRIEEGTDH